MNEQRIVIYVLIYYILYASIASTYKLILLYVYKQMLL